MEKLKSQVPKFVDLLVSQNRILKMIADDKPLGDTLDALTRLVENQSPGVLASILVLDPPGKLSSQMPKR